MKLAFDQKVYNEWYRSTEHGESVRKRLNAARSVRDKMYDRAKRRADESGIEFSISREDVVVPEYCPITGLILREAKGSKGFRPDSPSLDRIDVRKGYTKTNIGVISMRANKCKSDLHLEEIKNLYFYSIRQQEEMEECE